LPNPTERKTKNTIDCTKYLMIVIKPLNRSMAIWLQF